MKVELLTLRKLQVIDNHMVEARRAQAALDLQLKDLRTGLDLLNHELLRQEVDLDETRQLKEEHETALRSQEEAINRSKSRMTGVKKTHEMNAVQREMDNARKAASSKEEELLKIIEVEEQTRKALQERRDRLTELTAAFKTFETNYTGRSAEVHGRVAALEEQRQEQLKNLSQKLVRLYERIREARDGTAVAEVRDELCLVCHMGLPPQLYNELQRGDQIVTCPSCNRILYFDPERDSAAGK